MTVVGPFCVVAHALFAANAEVVLIIGCLLDHLQLRHFSVVGFNFVPFFVSRDAVEFSPSAVLLWARRRGRCWYCSSFVVFHLVARN